MSTRCQIRIKNEYQQYDVYHHHDGYPEGVGADLKEYCKKLPSGGGSSWNPNRIVNELVKGAIQEGLAGQTQPDMGYELSFGFHTDIEYAYLIDCEKKTLECYEVSWKEDYEDLTDIFNRAKVVEIPEKSN